MLLIDFWDLFSLGQFDPINPMIPLTVEQLLMCKINNYIYFFQFQVFHGVWTIAFFCLTVIQARAVLPNASCLLAGYLPATTVLHILLIPNNYPLEFIITDAIGTFLAIITMFLLLRMECTGDFLKFQFLFSLCNL
jgi:hypothetical protein